MSKYVKKSLYLIGIAIAVSTLLSYVNIPEPLDLVLMFITIFSFIGGVAAGGYALIDLE